MNGQKKGQSLFVGIAALLILTIREKVTLLYLYPPKQTNLYKHVLCSSLLRTVLGRTKHGAYGLYEPCLAAVSTGMTVMVNSDCF